MSSHEAQVLSELLILRAQGGQTDALGPLVDLWHERLLRHARHMVGSDHDARDLVQECWLEISRGLHALEDPASFGPWAFRIVTCRCNAWIRKRVRQRQVEASFAMTAPGTPRDGDASHASADDVEELRAAVRRLSPDQRSVLELHYLEGFTIAQIAHALEIAEGTVKSRLFNARQCLHAFLRRIHA